MIRHYWLRFKRDFLAYPIAMSAKYLLRVILKTCDITIEGLPEFIELINKEKCIVALWHNRLAILAEILNKNAAHKSYAAFISNSRDGEPLAILAASYKSGRALRVPHNAKHQALKMLINGLNKGRFVALFTPDGPKGPRYKVKRGLAMAAQEAQAAVVPFSWDGDAFWELRSWDKFRIPKPFSKIKVSFGNAVRIAQDQPLDEAIATLEKALKS